ncbi:MAG: calcium-binding protein [Gaiellales bacterium]
MVAGGAAVAILRSTYVHALDGSSERRVGPGRLMQWSPAGDEVTCSTPPVSSGTDCVHGTDRPDRIIGGHDRDVIFPGAGDDRVWGRGGDDRIDTAYGRDFVDAGADNDIVFTHGNDDRIYGGFGTDHLHPGNGEDFVDGGFGGDTIFVAGDGRADRVRCGRGLDYVYADPVDKVARDCERVRRPPS